ncbi:hypothetical protein P7K49_027609, partial [Saguinus oedipus]
PRARLPLPRSPVPAGSGWASPLPAVFSSPRLRSVLPQGWAVRAGKERKARGCTRPLCPTGSLRFWSQR